MVTSFLLKKRTNSTPYSLISYFQKKKQAPHATMCIHYSNMKLLKTLNNHTTLEYF
jgi:hypothetical protein